MNILLSNFLKHSHIIDWQHPSILETAKTLANGCDNHVSITHLCFEFVRDEIQHSVDFKRNGTTCKASDVLKQGHGFCYAKSHLLAALLRANNIPTALCYQRLTICDFPEDGQALTYCLHGLNAIYLPEIMQHHGFAENTGWYRVDARGNKTGVNAQFSAPTEQLAFAIKSKGEKDFSDLYAEPMPCVVDVLNRYTNYEDVMNNLPDINL